MPDRPLWTLRGVGVDGRTQPRLTVDELTIGPGRTAIVGASGAGKSTLLDVLAGVITPHRGTVEAAAASVFLGGADGGLWPRHSVREHLELVGDPDPAATLARFDLSDAAAARPPQLSQGQRTRLSIARALAADPQALVLDEPLSHLDTRRQRATAEAILQWCGQTAIEDDRDGQKDDDTPRSLVVATHRTDWLPAFARTVVLHEGRIVADGPTDSLLADPPSDEAAWSLGLRGLLAAWVLMVLTLTGCEASTQPIVDPVSYIVPNDGPRLPAPRAVTTDGDDRRLVLDNAGRILVYSAGRELVGQFAMPDASIGKPEGIVVFPDGRIAVADTHYSRVVIFNADGTVASMFGSRGDGPGQFLFPVAIARADDGTLFVAEYGGNDRVQRFSADGVHERTFGSVGTGRGELQRPSGLHIEDGRVYVTDSINNRIQVFSVDGEFLDTLGTEAELHWPYDLAVARGGRHAGRFVVPEYGSGTVAVLSRRGELVARYGRVGRNSGELYTPWGLATDSAGTIIVADTGNHRLVEFLP